MSLCEDLKGSRNLRIQWRAETTLRELKICISQGIYSFDNKIEFILLESNFIPRNLCNKVAITLEEYTQNSRVLGQFDNLSFTNKI